MILPPEFVSRIRRQLGDEADAFLHIYSRPAWRGLRLNTLKISGEDAVFGEMQDRFRLKPVPWCPDGYYYAEETRPGRHPYHAAGLYYIQEPSAMSVVEWMAPEPGELVLDLAAAPGGKSAQIAARMKGKGLLVANEIHAGRAKILSENMERMGIAHSLVTSGTPDELAHRFPLAFDRILLDAPCSGEGMFRKEPEAIAEWSPEQVERCAARQADILEKAASMLKPGGVLAYSTCTFAPEENERQIARFLERHAEFEAVRTEQIWPHRNEGEGHFAAVLRKTPDHPGPEKETVLSAWGMRDRIRKKGKSKKDRTSSDVVQVWKLFEQFVRNAGLELPDLDMETLLFGPNLYWLPRHPAVPDLPGPASRV